MNKRFATIPQVADLLVVSVATVRRRIADGKIPVHRVGRQIRIDLYDLNRFINGCRESDNGQTDFGAVII